MRILSVSRCVLIGVLVSLLVSVSFCYGDDTTVEVVGLGECADCKESNIETSQAFSGLRVTVDCKTNEGHFQTRGVGELDKEGKFKVSLPKEIMEDGKLKEECYAQLHSASLASCPAHNGIESSRIVFQSKFNEKHTFSTAGKLKFSTPVCTSAFLWPKYKYSPKPTLPPLTPHPWKKYLPPMTVHPWKKKYLPPLSPHPWKKYLPPLPPHPWKKSPVYTYPPTPVYTHPPKPVYTHPPTPVYTHPPTPVYTPKPVYTHPPTPVYTPKPVYTHPPTPVYTPKPVYTYPPIYKKPCPPIVPLPKPIYKKPCPPIVPLPQLPPKFSHHPKLKYLPPLPPHFPHRP